MNIQQFQYVLAVVDFKNFELAAEHCFVTQSTLSTMIGRLEDEMGIKIFNRKTKPVSLTKEGEELIIQFRVILKEIDSLKNVVQELKGEVAGELRMGIIPTIAPFLLPLFLKSFAEAFPKVEFIVREMTTADIQKALRNRVLDIGILAIPLEDPDLTELPLYDEPFLIYDCREEPFDGPISIEELDYSKLFLLQEGHCLRTQVLQICELSNQYTTGKQNFEFESGSMDSLLRFTKANEGMTIVPFLASLDLPAKDKKCLVDFKLPTPVRSIGLITHKHFVKKRLLQELQKAIQQAVEKNQLSLSAEHHLFKPL
ncbi:LysR family transcriptional regulator [bacterium SCSIO 12741]|nr:LysR family transcriptional regulator [bacterium SCSIO 12741]